VKHKAPDLIVHSPIVKMDAMPIVGGKTSEHEGKVSRTPLIALRHEANTLWYRP
jgi:hypothetical protein